MTEKKYNVHLIEDHLYLGDYSAASSLDFLKTYKICYVINVTKCLPQHKDLFEDYLQIPLLDHEEENISKYFETCSRFIKTAIKEGKNVYVHCQAGISRSPTIICAYLMKKHGISRIKALEIIVKQGRSISPNPGFSSQLDLYEQKLIKDRQVRDRIEKTVKNLILFKEKCAEIESLLL